jgi:hypothetical protein
LAQHQAVTALAPGWLECAEMLQLPGLLVVLLSNQEPFPLYTEAHWHVYTFDVVGILFAWTSIGAVLDKQRQQQPQRPIGIFP